MCVLNVACCWTWSSDLNRLVNSKDHTRAVLYHHWLRQLVRSNPEKNLNKMNMEEPAVTDWLGKASAIASPAPTSSTAIRPCVQLPDKKHRDQQQEGGSKLVVTLTGWRRRCLFGFLLVLTIIVIINLSLTLWLLRAMQFSLNGIGNLKITPNGIQLNGEAMAMDTLMTSHISARKGRPLVMDSSQNITITARDNQGRSYNQLFLGDDRLEVRAREFSVKNSRNEILFSANRREVLVGADILRVSGKLHSTSLSVYVYYYYALYSLSPTTVYIFISPLIAA